MPTRAFFLRKPLSLILSSLMLLSLLGASAAHADDYTDVNRLIGAKQFPEALTKADKYLAGKPRDPQMRFLKGVIQSETAKTGDAIETFTQITQDYPELPEPYNNLAVLYAGQTKTWAIFIPDWPASPTAGRSSSMPAMLACRPSWR